MFLVSMMGQISAFSSPRIANHIVNVHDRRVVTLLPATSVLPQVGEPLEPLESRAKMEILDSSATKLGVLLLNLGGPEDLKDVEGFLYNLFADPDIIRLPKFVSGIQKPLASFLSKRRAPQSREAYESIGGGSPIVQYTTAQAKALEKTLQSEQFGFSGAKCYIGMRYWYPFTEQALEEILNDGINALVILPVREVWQCVPCVWLYKV